MSGSRRVYAGLGFALITSLVWGVLPLVFDELLLVLDAPTVLCTRFLMATVVWFTVLGATGRRPRPGSLSARGWWVLVLGSLALAANSWLFLVGLEVTSPAFCQVLIQLAPVFLSAGGMLLFGERYTTRQWIGVSVLALGMVAFLARTIGLHDAALSSDRPIFGGIMIVTAALTWAVYGLAQKWLQTLWPKGSILAFVALLCGIVFLPLADLSPLADLTPAGWVMLLYSGLALVVAYGSLSAAFERVEASRVAAIIAMTPLFTLLLERVDHALLRPGRAAGPPELLTLAAALVVVAGAVTIALSEAPADVPSSDTTEPTG